MPSPTHYVYLLRCGNGTIYVGQTHDIEVRMGRHRNGTGARHTAQNKPFEVIYTEWPMSLEEAIARERQLKKWSLAKKLALADGKVDFLRRLSRSKSPPSVDRSI